MRAPSGLSILKQDDTLVSRSEVKYDRHSDAAGGVGPVLDYATNAVLT